jgi:hypothetical protein
VWQCNEAAHVLARSAERFVSCTFRLSAPECIRKTLCNDLLWLIKCRIFSKKKCDNTCSRLPRAHLRHRPLSPLSHVWLCCARALGDTPPPMTSTYSRVARYQKRVAARRWHHTTERSLSMMLTATHHGQNRGRPTLPRRHLVLLFYECWYPLYIPPPQTLPPLKAIGFRVMDVHSKLYILWNTLGTKKEPGPKPSRNRNKIKPNQRIGEITWRFGQSFYPWK